MQSQAGLGNDFPQATIETSNEAPVSFGDAE